MSGVSRRAWQPSDGIGADLYGADADSAPRCPQCARVVEPVPCLLTLLRMLGRCSACASSDKRSARAFDRMPQESRDAWHALTGTIASGGAGVQAGAKHDAELGRLTALVFRTVRPATKARRVAACVAYSARMERVWLVAGRLLLSAAACGTERAHDASSAAGGVLGR